MLFWVFLYNFDVKSQLELEVQ